MTRTAIYAGSFDPITNGHVDIVRRSLNVFDEVVVLIAENPRKMSGRWFSVEDREELIRRVFASERRVRVDVCTGLVMDYARKHKISAMVRGLRAAGDFENEFMMASINRDLNPDVETVFMITSRDWFFVSSSLLKEVVTFGGDVSAYVPRVVAKALEKKRQ